MRKIALLIVFLLACMSLSPGVAQVVAPNDVEEYNGVKRVLSIDGYVTTKFAGVGSDVEIRALTRGHSTSTLVTAEIIQFPSADPIDVLTTANLPGSGVVIDTVVLTRSGAHEDDSDTMTWKGVYTVPTEALGGVYGASVIAEDGNLRATDDPTQLGKLLRGELEHVMRAIDDAWQLANPTMVVKAEFDSFETKGTSHGGWGAFVDAASEGQGVGGSAQFWDAMITAGHDKYNLSGGSNFLEAFLEFLDSDDIDASLSMITGLMVYAHEFPLGRSFDDFPEVVEYLQAFDPIENFTQFEETGDFEAAYNALLGSEEYLALREALDDLANNTRQFLAMQTILHNIALLAVSGHPDAINDAMEAWATPLFEGDFANMTPFQRLVIRWVEMDFNSTDLDGDKVPDQIIWEYELLLETSEGQAWTAKMESSSAWVNDAMDDFNTLPEDLINIVWTSMQDEAWNATGDVISAFFDWMDNATGQESDIWWFPSEEEDDEDGSDDIVFEELYDIRTFAHDQNVLDLGVELYLYGLEDEDYPNQFQISMTNDDSFTVTTSLVQDEDNNERYVGRLTAQHVESAIWAFSQPLENFDSTDVQSANLKMESLRPGMLELLPIETPDEQFVVSAVGVLVEQELTVSAASPFSVNTLSYDHAGAVENADVDIAILRISPQVADDAFAQFESEGEVEHTLESDEVGGTYDGDDLNGDVTGRISDYEEEREGIEHPQLTELNGDIEVAGNGATWSTLPPTGGGLATVTTLGTTETGLEFEFTEVVPLPGTSGCGSSGFSGDGGSEINIGWDYDNFLRYDNGEFPYVEYDKPELASLEIDWGDGSVVEEHSDNGNEAESWEYHDYGSDPLWEDNEYDITVTYKDANGGEIEHALTYKPDKGFEVEGDYRDWVELGWCDLEASKDFKPSAEIIDGFITDGPFEVMDEQEFKSDADGIATMLATPSLPGFYVTIAQSKVRRDDGHVMTGVGLNFAYASNGSLAIGGMTQETTLMGMPVYAVNTTDSGLATISLTPSGIGADEFTAELTVGSFNFSVPFPDIDTDVWMDEQKYEIDFQQGDTTRTQEVRISAPISYLFALIADENDEVNTAAAVGLIVANHGALNLTGALGPDQVTNVALAEEEGEASRILALAAPEMGFDPASIDFSGITEMFYQEAARPAFGWITAEQKVEQSCEQMSVWHEERWDDGEMSNIRMELFNEQSDFANNRLDYDPTGAVLTDEDGTVIEPTSDWSSYSWEESYYANFMLPESGDENIEYTLTTNTGHDAKFSITYNPDEEDIFSEQNELCDGDVELTEAKTFDLFVEIVNHLDSVAWGIGPSADLRLPILSSPNDDYTVLALAQKGSGENATLVAAIGHEVSVPNPEPPAMENLTLSFSPPNPMPGDTVQIAVRDEAYQPVPGLSVLLVKDNQTLVASISNDDGRTSFAIPAGTIYIRVSGGNYYPAELTIIVSDEGVQTEDGTELPADSDDDGVLDDDDEFPDDPNESVDSDGDGVGDNSDAFPDDPDETMDSDGDGIGDNAEASSNADSSTSPNLLLIGGAVAAVLTLLTTLVLVAMKRRNSLDESEWSQDLEDTDPESLVDDGQLFSQPSFPSPSAQGQMQDGYETIEHPAGTGAWFYRDQETGNWMEWR